MRIMSKMKKNRGRPSTKYDEQEIYAVINHYRKNICPHGDIKYLQLYRYHLKLHNEHPEICSRIYSEDFWRKKGQPGREAIENANKIRTVTLVDANNNKKDIPNVADVVDKYSTEPERLIKHLQPIENELRRSIQKERELKKKNEDLKIKLEEERKNKRKLREQTELLQESIFKLFHYSDKDGTPLENLLDLNNKNKRIENALEEAFSSPQRFYTKFEEYYQKTSNKHNVVALDSKKNKKNKSLSDDFDGLF